MSLPPIPLAAEGEVDLGPILIAVFIAFVAAKVAGELMERLHQPRVVGELIAGVIVGPSVLGWIPTEGTDGTVMLLLAELGVIVLLFQVGLETEPSELRAVGGQAMAVAVLGVVFPFALGYGVAAIAGHSGAESAFVAAALVATSVGITARVLADLGKTTKRSSRVILGAAVIDDILGLMVLAVVVGVTAGSLEPAEMVLLIVEALGFVGALLIFGPRLMNRIAHLLEWPKIPRSPFAVSVAILLGLSVAAAELQLAAIVGAFLAGTVLSTTREHYALEHQFEPVADLLTPFFFIVTGAQIDVGIFGKGSVLLLAGALTVVAIAGKLAGGIMGSRGLTRRERLIIGVGMIPRGEVGIIVAGIGFTREIIDVDLFGAVLIMVIVTTLAAPPFLQRLFASEDRAAAERPGA